MGSRSQVGSLAPADGGGLTEVKQRSVYHIYTYIYTVYMTPIRDPPPPPSVFRTTVTLQCCVITAWH